MVPDHSVRVYTVKANTYSNITHALRQVLGMESSDTTDERELSRFGSAGRNSQIDALEEARLAVEQIVIPKGQPVELLPRSAKVRLMQHELVERYHLKSHSFGEEPFRRLRIFPA